MAEKAQWLGVVVGLMIEREAQWLVVGLMNE